MGFILLEESVLSTGVTIFFGLIGMVITVALIIYMKAGISSLTNTRYIDRSGKTVVTPDTFKGINEFVAEKITDAKHKVLGTEPLAPIIRQPVHEKPIKVVSINSDEIVPGIGLNSFNIGDRILNLYPGFSHTLSAAGIFQSKDEIGISFFSSPAIGGTITQITIYAPNKSLTKEGIGIGSSVQSVYDKYGVAVLKGAKGTSFMFACYDGIRFGYQLQNQNRLLPNDTRKIEVIMINSETENI